jgi:hypothetical protein
MINRTLIFALFLSVSCYGDLKSRLSSSGNDLFDEFLKSFQVKGLPLEMDRTEVSKIKNVKQASSIIAIDIYEKYIPVEIWNNDTSNPTSYRGIYLLPRIHNNVVVLIAQDIFIESEMYSAVKIYLVIYQKDNEILDFKEVAMFRPDIAEAFCKISDTYKIEKRMYQRKMNTNKEYSKLAYMIETKSEFKVDENGFIMEASNTNIEGYFELVSGEYMLIKQIN